MGAGVAIGSVALPGVMAMADESGGASRPGSCPLLDGGDSPLALPGGWAPVPSPLFLGKTDGNIRQPSQSVPSNSKLIQQSN